MRKTWKFLLFLSVTVVLLCTTALAADGNSGIYDVTSSNGVSMTPVGTATSVNINGTEETVYVGAEKVNVTYSDATANVQYLVLVTIAELGNAAPTESNIVYIDQKAADSDGVTFTVYPSSLSEDTKYYVYLSDSNEGLTEVGTFRYYADYIRGDANSDNQITVSDATAVVSHVAEIKLLTGKQLSAAEVTGDGLITVSDAQKIISKVAELIDSL